jgi:hypothetical protein
MVGGGLWLDLVGFGLTGFDWVGPSFVKGTSEGRLACDGMHRCPDRGSTQWLSGRRQKSRAPF